MRAAVPPTCFATLAQGRAGAKPFLAGRACVLVGQLSDRLAFLTRRYGSDPAAWQGEIHALAALEASAPKEALEQFYLLKRRLAEFRRAELLRALRRFTFVRDVPGEDARGYDLKELEADIREASRALTLAREIERGLAEEADARASLQRRPRPPRAEDANARWDALVALAMEVESRRRVAAREARLERRLADVVNRARRAQNARITIPEATLDADELDAALDVAEAALDRAEAVADAYRAAIEPLRAPEVATFRHGSRRRLEREAEELVGREDVPALRELAARAEALRREAAGLASQAARSRRTGAPPPPRERRTGDTMDGYG